MKILIADDHELFLQGLLFILEKEYAGAQIVTAANYTDIFNKLAEHKDFDLIITDLAMPGANWLDALKKIHNDCPEVPIIIISAVFERSILQKTFDIGVSGYISKAFPNSLIISAINLVLAGGVYIPQELLRENMTGAPEQINLLLDNQETDDNKDAEAKILTPRQMDVLNCLAKGMPNKLIARELGLSEGTVKIHITLILRALEVGNRLAAVREAVKRGIISKNNL
ncbi:MAG: response regulator transcription factor [Alphaproteobacteria bacterium]|nr:response regulator transcription factor [Alphaproteobacteria bacterium]